MLQDAHLDESDVLAREILFTSPLCISVQILMIYCGIKFRCYSKKKEEHDQNLHVGLFEVVFNIFYYFRISILCLALIMLLVLLHLLISMQKSIDSFTNYLTFNMLLII